VFSRRVLVSETSVVEADSKHLGDASKESREAHEERIVKRQEGEGPGTGLTVILFAQGCNGPRWSKGRREPSVAASFDSSVPRSSLGGRSPGC
jgi:hypothetical protein